MTRTLVFGNSGAGKSTLAKALCNDHGVAHLDLDTLAWKPGLPPERAPLEQSAMAIERFMHQHTGWVIEGCYTDLLEVALPQTAELIFLNLPVEVCIANARKRPWEPHKYASKAAQDANLEMLIDWIAQYPHREDTCSLAAHTALYTQFTGTKQVYIDNADHGGALPAANNFRG